MTPADREHLDGIRTRSVAFQVTGDSPVAHAVNQVLADRDWLLVHLELADAAVAAHHDLTMLAALKPGDPCPVCVHRGPA